MFEKLILDNPIVLFGLVFLIALSALQAAFKSKPRRNLRRPKSKNWHSNASDFPNDSKSNLTSTEIATEQLKVVMHAKFYSRPLLNQKELRVFSTLEKLLEAEAVDWRLMAQVSMGEIIGSSNKAAYLAVNSKRVDLLIIDSNGRPLHAIEYQGAGHHQGTAAVRDTVKREALRRAGIGYEEVREGDRLDDLKSLVAKLARPLKA